MTYVTTALYVVYTLTLVPSRRPRLTHLHYSLSIEDADSLGSPDPPGEHDPLLPAGGRHVQVDLLQFHLQFWTFFFLICVLGKVEKDRTQ